MREFFLQGKDQIAELMKRLDSCPLIARYGPDEAGTLVNAFSDIEGSIP